MISFPFGDRWDAARPRAGTEQDLEGLLEGTRTFTLTTHGAGVLAGSS